MASTQNGWKYRDLLIFDPFSPSSLFYFTYIDIYGFWGARYKRVSNFISYLDCHTPKKELVTPIIYGWITQYGWNTWDLLIFNHFDTIHNHDLRYYKYGSVLQTSITTVTLIVVLHKCVGYINKILVDHPVTGISWFLIITMICVTTKMGMLYKRVWLQSYQLLHSKNALVAPIIYG